MSERFSSLTKLPKQPAARLLALANAKLQTPLDAPASASVEIVLAELEQKGALIDMLRLMSVALPVRERVWWSCLAARDTVPEGANPPLALSTAEKWVFKPNEENRIAAQGALDHADVYDETVHCATAVLFCDGTLGPGELSRHPAPPGVSEVSAFAMNIIALGSRPDDFEAFGAVLLDRALDIARGGPGRIAAPSATTEGSTR